MPPRGLSSEFARAARCWTGSSTTARSSPPCCGQDGATLFLLAAEWRGVEHVDEAVAARTGQVLLTKAPSPGAGWP